MMQIFQTRGDQKRLPTSLMTEIFSVLHVFYTRPNLTINDINKIKKKLTRKPVDVIRPIFDTILGNTDDLHFEIIFNITNMFNNAQLSA